MYTYGEQGQAWELTFLQSNSATDVVLWVTSVNHAKIKSFLICSQEKHADEETCKIPQSRICCKGVHGALDQNCPKIQELPKK